MFSLNKLRLILVSLLVVLLLLGIILYVSFSKRSRETYDNQARVETLLGDDAKLALKPLPKNPTVEQRKIRFEAAQRAAQESEVVSIMGCFANPAVLKAKLNQTVLFRNRDKNSHLIKFTDKTISLPASKVKSLVLDFDKGPGLYGYSCDDHSYLSGLILLEK